MLPATPAKLLQLQPVRRRFPVLGLRVVPLFALTALQRNDLSGHCSLPGIAKGRSQNAELESRIPIVLVSTSAFFLLTSSLLTPDSLSS